MVGAYRPATLQEALRIRSDSETIVMAGGTDLYVRYRSWAGTLPSFPKDLLLVGHLPELRRIDVGGGQVRIGAAVVFRDILDHPGVPGHVKPPLAMIGSPAIRNLGTLGGNLCNASPAGDSLPMLYALDAVLTLASNRGTRECPVSDFLSGPGRSLLAEDEILVDIVVPTDDYDRLFYRKVGQRRANAVARVSFYGIAKVESGHLRELRMALGAVAPVVARCPEAEALLEGLALSEVPEGSVRSLDRLFEYVMPIDDIRASKDFRRDVARSLAERFLEEVATP